MKTKTIREFEEGDVVVCVRYNHAAIKVASNLGWAHTNAVGRNDKFNDKHVNELLDSGNWVYLGNRLNHLPSA